MEYKIATFNMKREGFGSIRSSFGFRFNLLEKFFFDASPDIVGTQELTLEALRSFDVLGDSYTWVGEPRSKGIKGEYTAIFYNHDKFDLVEHDTFWLSLSPKKRGSRSWLSLFPRTCTWCVLRSKKSGENIRIYNTHLDCLSPFARFRGIKLIKRLAEKYDSDELAGTVIMGDFNASPKSKTVKYLISETEESVFKDTYNALVCGDKHNLRTYHGFSGRIKGLPIDYIFTSKNIEIKSAYIDRSVSDDKYPSDHYPVVAFISVNKK